MTESAAGVLRVQIIGAGRVGRALHAGLVAAGWDPLPLGGRGSRGDEAEVVILAVPDSAIASAAALVAPGRLVGHVSGATPLTALGERESFGLHPLLTIVSGETDLSGCVAAVSGSTEVARDIAARIARALGMRPHEIAEADRAAYHAAASMASNFVTVLLGAAADLVASAGVPEEGLEPLASAAVRNWASLGARDALTGPVARGDEATVERQRAAVAERTPQHAELFAQLVLAARRLAAQGSVRVPLRRPPDGRDQEAGQ